MSGFRWRFLWPVSLGTLCLVALCAFTAVSLFHQQATITGVLRENVSSRRAASDLRGTLNILVALETHQIESVADLHARAQAHLTEIRQLANHPGERELSAQLDDGFAAYLKEWQSLPPKSDPAAPAPEPDKDGKLTYGTVKERGEAALGVLDRIERDHGSTNVAEQALLVKAGPD